MTNPIESRLLWVLADGEEPLYSAYRETTEGFGDRLGLEGFLGALTEFLSRDVVRLWEVSGGDRVELYEVPQGLARRYREAEHSDPTFDPFSLSLTSTAREAAPPEWELDIDVEAGTYQARFAHAREVEVLQTLATYFPDITFREDQRHVGAAATVVRGTISLS